MRRLLCALWATLFLVPLAGWACTCQESPPVACQGLNVADAIFVGTVTVAEIIPAADADAPQVLHYRFRIDERFKAAESREIDIYSGGNDGDCGYRFKKGAQYLVLSYSSDDGRLFATICSGTRPAREARAILPQLRAMKSNQRVASIFGVLRQTDPPYDAVKDPEAAAGDPTYDTLNDFTEGASPTDRESASDPGDDPGAVGSAGPAPRTYRTQNPVAHRPLRNIHRPIRRLFHLRRSGRRVSDPRASAGTHGIDAAHVKRRLATAARGRRRLLRVQHRRAAHGPNSRPGARPGRNSRCQQRRWNFTEWGGTTTRNPGGGNSRPRMEVLILTTSPPGTTFSFSIGKIIATRIHLISGTFYPTAADLASAQPVKVSDGGEVVTADIHVKAGFATRTVKVRIKWTGHPLPGNVFVTSKADQGENPASRKVGDLLYELTLLDDVRYTISAWTYAKIPRSASGGPPTPGAPPEAGPDPSPAADGAAPADPAPAPAAASPVGAAATSAGSVAPAANSGPMTCGPGGRIETYPVLVDPTDPPAKEIALTFPRPTCGE